MGVTSTGGGKETPFVVSTTARFTSEAMHQRIADSIRRGKVVCEHYGVDLFEVDYYGLANRPVGEIRELLSVPPKSSGAIEGGSAGVFDLEGMSENQRRVVAQRRGDNR